MSASNNAHYVGRIPTSEKLAPRYFENEEITKSVYNGLISVRRNYKPKDAQYYPEDLIKFTAFGYTAKYLHDNVKPGDIITIEGPMYMGEDYEDKDGNVRKGQLYCHVSDASKLYFRESSDNSDSNEDSENEENTQRKSSRMSAIERARARRKSE